MNSIQINDIFEELSEENERLLNELKFADKCLKVFKKFKIFIDSISDNLRPNLDSNVSKKFEEFNNEVEEVLSQKFHKNSNKEVNDLSINDMIALKPKKTLRSLKLKKNLNKNSKTNVKQSFGTNIERIASIKSENQFQCQQNGETEEQPINRYIKEESNGSENSLDLKNRVFCAYVGCGRHYSSRDNMRDHYKTHFLENSLMCSVEGCGYRCWRPNRMRTHMNIHNAVKSYECNSCNKTFTTNERLISHIQRIHTLSEQLFVCNIDDCNKSFNNELSLKTHQKNNHLLEKKIVCNHPNCDYRTLSKCFLEVHRERTHSVLRPYVCTFKGCAKTFKCSKDQVIHIRSHSLERKYKCLHEGCDKAFKTNKDLTIHKMGHSDVKISCDWPGCEYQTNRPRILKSHQLVHISDRNFVCHWPKCEKTFKRRGALSIHLRIHNFDKRYACHWPGCQYRCVDSNNLSKHMRVHRK